MTSQNSQPEAPSSDVAAAALGATEAKEEQPQLTYNNLPHGRRIKIGDRVRFEELGLKLEGTVAKLNKASVGVKHAYTLSTVKPGKLSYIPTAEETAQQAREAREWAIREARQFIDKPEGSAELTFFAERFAKDPAYALETASSAFEAAAMARVCKAAAKIWERVEAEKGVDAAVEAVIKEARGAVMNRARNPSRSSSACHNMLSEAETSAWATLVERLAWILPTIREGAAAKEGA